MNKLLPLFWLAPLAATAGTITERDFEEVLTNVAATGLIEVDNTSGYVEIKGADTKNIVLRGRLDRNVESVEIETDRGRVAVRVRNKSRTRSWDSGEAILEMTVPRGSELDVTTVSAEIEIDDIIGEQRLKSVSGSIETDAYSKNVVAGSVSGDVTINGNGGDMEEVRVSSVSGDVYGERLSGEIEANSVSGDVIIRESRVTNGDFSTTSGDIEVIAAIVQGARLDFESVSGDVRLSIDGKHDGSYDISTFSGDIENCFGPEPDRRRSRDQRVRFAEGDEDHARIDVTTMSGDIEVCN